MTDTVPSAPYVLPEEARYFSGLVDEIPGYQMEATVNLSGVREPATVVEGLLGHFSGSEGRLGAFVPHPMSTTQTVDKYASTDGSFSVVHLGDGSLVLKRKRHLGRRHGVGIALERRAQLATGDDPIQLWSAINDTAATDVTRLGTLERDKQRIAVVNHRSGRVYVVTFDNSRIEMPDTADAAPELHQLAIEYKGTLAEQAHGPDRSARDDIVGDIKTIRKQSRHYLEAHHVSVSEDAQSKTRWIRDQTGAADPAAMMVRPAMPAAASRPGAHQRHGNEGVA